MYCFSSSGVAGTPPAANPYRFVGPINTSPFGPYVLSMLANIGTIALQSGHQCAQKNSKTGCPRKAAIGCGLGPSHSFVASGGAGFPSRGGRVMVFVVSLR